MCTAASFRKCGFYFGRTLDNDKSYGEEVVFAPQDFPLWRGGGAHYKILGMATVAGGLPLYYDGMNEKGLCMAGLNFASNAKYNKPAKGKINLAQYEFLPYVLGTCADVKEAVRAIKNINITDERFSPEMPPAPLHWMISDGERDIVAECMVGGMRVYDNAVGVLTNNPPFDKQLFNLNNFMALSAGEPQNTFCPQLGLEKYCCGMGALGLPGDWSSQSRFVRAAFIRNNYVLNGGEGGSDALFNILGGVFVPRGCCRSGGGWQTTIYTCCMDARIGQYSYKSYCGGAPQGMSFAQSDGSSILRREI